MINNINKCVAVEVMGWHWGVPAIGSAQNSYPHEGWYDENNNFIIRDNFNPTTSWNDAGLIIERMRELGWQIAIFQDNPRYKEGWTVHFELEDENEDQIGWSEAIADTAPLAICLASLKAMEGE